jgi:hypothetical protein
MNQNSMTCDTPEALRFFATASEKAASEWMRKAADEIERLRLTDEERRVILVARDAYADDDGNAECESIAAVLSGLLERLK